MVMVKTIQKRKATIVVEAFAEVIMLPSRDLDRWANIFVKRIKKFSSQYAPVHNWAERPLRPHGGKHLKDTFVSSKPRFWSNGKDKQRLYAGVGSTAAYAAFVDQGTGAHYAKILPPWKPGEPSLRESTWHAPGQPPIGPILVKGQQGKFFMDKGIKRAFQSMRMRSYQLPMDPRVAETIAGAPTYGPSIPQGNNSMDPMFGFRLREWRSWRDAAWKVGDHIGKDYVAGRKHRTVVREQALREEADRTKARNARANYNNQTKSSNRRANQDQARVTALAKAKKTSADRQEREKSRKRAENQQGEEFARIRREQKAQGFVGSLSKVVLKDSSGKIIGYGVVLKDANGSVIYRKDFPVN